MASRIEKGKSLFRLTKPEAPFTLSGKSAIWNVLGDL